MPDSPATPAVAPAPSPRPDAILCPAHYPKLRAGEDRHQKFKEEFGPILGSPRVYARHADPGRFLTLITGQPDDTKGRGISRYFPSYHPLAGQERYSWADRGDGVQYGTLTPEAVADERE